PARRQPRCTHTNTNGTSLPPRKEKAQARMQHSGEHAAQPQFPTAPPAPQQRCLCFASLAVQALATGSSRRRPLPRTPLTAPAQRHGGPRCRLLCPGSFFPVFVISYSPVSTNKNLKIGQNTGEKRKSVEAHPQGKKKNACVRAGKM
ncbi:trans-sialidase, partial [Trypanosoma cruzi]